MRRLVIAIVLSIAGLLTLHVSTANALSSDPKLFISADNTFYSYVKGGETISAAFLRVNQDEPFDTVRGDVTVTLDGPGVPQQKCVISKDVAIGSGCRFDPVTAPKSGIWRVQFSVPVDAKTYIEVSPDVKWAKNLFNWDITVKSGATEQHGRTWTQRYAIRQPAAASFLDDFVNYYISEDGYIYKATSHGYNGQISTLSADAVGIRSGTTCTSAYHSTDVNDSKFSPALGSCGNGFKLFFEEPAGDLPTKATQWDDKSDWIRPDISRPALSELKFASDNSQDQQSGTISFYLKNFIGQYQIKVDVDGDGSFDGQDDVTINQQMKKLSNDLQKVHFSGVDKTGQVIATSQKIGVKVDITKVAEIHLVASDVEGRTGGIELTRLSGDNAPTTRICWNDTELAALADMSLMTPVLDGRSCPDSVGGVHGWKYTDSSWGNARYIDDWVYASAKLEGSNQIVYPDDQAAAVVSKKLNLPLVIGVSVISFIAVAGIIALLVSRSRRRRKAAAAAASVPPALPAPGVMNQTGQQLPPTDHYDGTPPQV